MGRAVPAVERQGGHALWWRTAARIERDRPARMRPLRRGAVRTGTARPRRVDRRVPAPDRNRPATHDAVAVHGRRGQADRTGRLSNRGARHRAVRHLGPGTTGRSRGAALAALGGGAGGVSDEDEPPRTPLEQAEAFALRFRNNANHLAIAYGGPLYLVGSALTSLVPGDIDLRLLLDRADCEAMWGEYFDHGCPPGEIYREWSAGKLARHREELKQS